MLAWGIALVLGVAAAALPYGLRPWREGHGLLAALRAAAAALVVALLLAAPAGPPRTPQAEVALDGSASLGRGRLNAVACWRAARDSAAAAGSPLLRFGDSLRADIRGELPTDRTSSLRQVADRAAGTGRPVVIVTDGELADGALFTAFPAGSRAIVVDCPSTPDVAVAEMDAPRALLVGDTITARATLVAGPRGGPAGQVELRLDDARLAVGAVARLEPYGEQVVELRGVVPGVERAAVLRAVVRAAGDGEPRDDTLALAVEVTRAPSAVFVSTAPDFDAREAVAALRGVTSLPTRAFVRVAPGRWRTDGALAAVSEAEVREAVRVAPMVVLHGDTAVFGPPRAATRGSLLLYAGPRKEQGEWFVGPPPASPIAGALGSLPLDSLSPLDVAPPAEMPRGAWEGLAAHRGGTTAERRAVLVGWDEPRRIAVLGATGLWRWRFRGGVRTQAYDALFGALYDWLAAGRRDRRAVLPEPGVLRAGVPLRWRRGAAGDSVVRVTLRRRDGTAPVQTVTLRFGDGREAGIAESAPLPAGLYEAEVPGGRVLLAVNVSRELVPRRPSVHPGPVGGTLRPDAAPSVRELGWLYALAIAALCVEWLLRRRAGLR